jgi:hypothetical protein
METKTSIRKVSASGDLALEECYWYTSAVFPRTANHIAAEKNVGRDDGILMFYESHR